jgi:hypothetical protein
MYTGRIWQHTELRPYLLHWAVQLVVAALNHMAGWHMHIITAAAMAIQLWICWSWGVLAGAASYSCSARASSVQAVEVAAAS